MFNENIFLALDEDETGVLDKKLVAKFVTDFLRGTQVPGTHNTSFEHANKESFKLLISLNDSPVVDKAELSIFMRDILISQVKELMKRIETEKYDEEPKLTK